MKKQTILSLLLMALALLSSVTQVFAGRAPQTGQATETPTLRPNLATQKANANATRLAAKLTGPREHYKGTVSATDPTSLTLALSDGSSVTIGLDARSRILYAAPKGSRSGRLRPGDAAMVQAVRTSEGALVALIVLVMPGKPGRAHHVGVVTEYAPGVRIVIQDKNGATRAFSISAATQLMPSERASLLATGFLVTIISQHDQGSNSDAAIGIVILSAVP